MDMEAVKVESGEPERIAHQETIRLTPEWLGKGDTLTIKLQGNWVLTDGNVSRTIRRMRVVGFVVDMSELED